MASVVGSAVARLKVRGLNHLPPTEPTDLVGKPSLTDSIDQCFAFGPVDFRLTSSVSKQVELPGRAFNGWLEGFGQAVEWRENMCVVTFMMNEHGPLSLEFPDVQGRGHGRTGVNSRLIIDLRCRVFALLANTLGSETR